MRAVLLALTILAATQAAPAPRPRPPLQPLPGWYTLYWHSSPWIFYLGKDGFMGCRPNVRDAWSQYQGTWRWDAKTRLLTVCEALASDEQCRQWTAVLDRDLAGEANYGMGLGSVRVRLEPRPDGFALAR